MIRILKYIESLIIYIYLKRCFVYLKKIINLNLKSKEMKKKNNNNNNILFFVLKVLLY